MRTESNDLAEIGARLRTLSDRWEITALCDRYARALDLGRHDDSWFDTVFTPDVELTFPMGTYAGAAGLSRFQEMSRGVFDGTFHLGGNYDIAVDGDQGQVHAHLMAVHVPDKDEPDRHFAIGGHYQAAVVRSAAGWRISRFVFDLVWRAGDPPAGGPASEK